MQKKIVSLMIVSLIVATMICGCSDKAKDKIANLAARQMTEIIENYMNNSDVARISFIHFVSEQIDVIPFEENGIANCAGVEGNDFENHGLGNVGFVAWCYASTFDSWPAQTVSGFVDSLQLSDIEKSELKVGDIGISADGSEIGIYIETDENDKQTWVYMSKEAQTVVQEQTDKFENYYSLICKKSDENN